MSQAPYTGDVFWCERFPGLHGNPAKERYAVVISPPGKLPDQNGDYLVVPTSSSCRPTDRVLPLPNKTQMPTTTSGLPSPCMAVCDEYKLVKPDVLTKWVGNLRTPMVAKLRELVLAVIQDRQSLEHKVSPPPKASNSEGP